MSFEEKHRAFIEHHLNRRTGERRGRLQRGHKEAEKLFCQHVWWPLRGNFEHLHPEYEVLDWRGLSYFCDFAWLMPSVRLIIEVKGFGPHVQDMDGKKYCNELNRKTFLKAMGYEVICLAYDDVAQRPDLCITLLRLVLSRYLSESSPIRFDRIAEMEIIKLAFSLARPLRPIDIVNHLGISYRAAIRILQTLCRKEVCTAIAGADGKRLVRYEVHPSAIRYL